MGLLHEAAQARRQLVHRSRDAHARQPEESLRVLAVANIIPFQLLL